MKKYIFSFLLFLVPFITHGAYLTDITPALELDCFHAKNTSTLTLDVAAQAGAYQIVRIPPGQTVIFSGSQWSNTGVWINPRFQMIASPFTVYGSINPIDCRTSTSRGSVPQYWTDYWFPPSCSSQVPSCVGTSCDVLYNPISFNQSWTKDSLSCGFECTNGYTGSLCLDPPYVPPEPVNISGYIESSIIPYNSYSWNVTLNLSTGATIPVPSDLLYWDFFQLDSIVSIGTSVVLTFVTFPETNQPIPCSSYSVTVPVGALEGLDGVSTNDTAIVGSFTVDSCPAPPPPPDVPLDHNVSDSGSLTVFDENKTYITAGYIGDKQIVFDFYTVVMALAVVFFSGLLLRYLFK